MKKFLKIMIALSIFVMLTACAKKSESNNKNKDTENTTTVEAAELQDVGIDKFDFQTLDIIDGEMIKSEEFYAEKPLTFINIWGTFCSPCIEEMPELEKLNQKYKDKMNFLGVVSDTNATMSTNVEEAIQILDKSGVTYTNIMPNPTMEDTMNKISVIPTTLIVKSDGTVLGGFVGAMSYEQWDNAVSKVLEENK